MTLQEICEKAGCTQKDIVEAITAQSKANQFLHYNAEKEARAQAKALEAQYQALKQENIRMNLLLENWRLSKEMKLMDAERKEIEQQKKLEELAKNPQITEEPATQS